MNEDIDDRLTDEEIYLICGEKLTKEYDLTNMYSVCDKTGPNKSCPDCGLPKTDENAHLFYNYKYTRCKACSKRYTREYAKENREKIKLYSRE